MNDEVYIDYEYDEYSRTYKFIPETEIWFESTNVLDEPFELEGTL
jgi:hypothetical protein